MDKKYLRALDVGLAFGVVLTGCNMLAYLWYQKQMDDFWASETSKHIDPLCVGLDTYFYLIILTAIVYTVCGICTVIYARRYLERRAHASRAAALAGLMAAALSLLCSELLIQGGIFLTGATFSGWVQVYGMYAFGGIFLAVIAGALYFESLHDKFKTGPP